MNTLPNVYKLFHYNLTMSPIYLIKLKITHNQPTAYAVHSVEPIDPDFRESHSMFVSFLFVKSSLPVCSLLTENLLHSDGICQNLSSNSTWLILTRLCLDL